MHAHVHVPSGNWSDPDAITSALPHFIEQKIMLAVSSIRNNVILGEAQTVGTDWWISELSAFWCLRGRRMACYMQLLALCVDRITQASRWSVNACGITDACFDAWFPSPSAFCQASEHASARE